MNMDGKFSVFQNHTGPGDNVSGNKTVLNINHYADVYTDVAPTHIKKVVLSILNDLRDYKVDEAKKQLATILLIDNLDEESSAIIETLSIHCNLIEKQNIENALLIINTYLANHKNPLIRDLCLSAFIKLSCQNGDKEAALERFRHETCPGIFSKKAYFDFLADSSELENTFCNNKYSLTENELEGIIQGALRLDDGYLAFDVAEFLNKTFNSYNSKFLLLYSKAIRLNPVITTVHYWLCTAQQRDEFLNVANEIVLLFEESQEKDYRLFNIATPIIDYLRGDHEKLLFLCKNNLGKIAEINESVASRIDPNRLTENNEDPNYILFKASNNEKYKKVVSDNLLVKKEISSSELYVLMHIASPSQLKKWAELGGIIVSENDIEKDFCSLSLKISTAVDNKNLEYIQEIKRDFDLLMDKLVVEKSKFNPEYILSIAQKLLSVKLAYEAAKLLKLLINTENDFWNSPLIGIYIECLYSGQQYLTLSSFLGKVKKETWNSYIYIIKAAITAFSGNLKGAEVIIKESINFDELNAQSWLYLIDLNIKQKSTDLEDIFNKIPENIFSKPTENGLSLLILMAKNNLFHRAEKVIFSWFLENPNDAARYLSNFHLNLIVKDHREDADNDKKILFSTEIGDCIGGITYKSDDKPITQLIVKNLKTSHPVLLNSASPIANFLNSLTIGEKKKYLMNTIEIIKRSTPYITAVTLANDLRVSLNDGTDGFYPIIAPDPDSPQEIIKVLTEKLSFNKESTYDKIFKNPNLPILFKSNLVGKKFASPIEDAIHQFTNAKFVKHDLISFGEELSKDVILDIYTICYLSLTQLSKNIESASLNIKITDETKECIENWILDVESGKYLRAGVDDSGNFRTTTHVYIQRNFGDMITQMKHIIEIADVVQPELIDVPNELLFYNEFFSPTTYSTAIASLSLNISWLCIDLALGYILKNIGFQFYNPSNLFCNLGNKLDFKSKKLGLELHALDCIPYVVTINDFYLLANSQDVFSDRFLTKMINKYLQAIDNSFEGYIEFLIKILTIFISNGYLQKKFLIENPRFDLKIINPISFGVDDVFYACCNNILKYPSDLASEEKIAFFLSHLFDHYKNIKQVIEWLQIVAYLYTSGHFMDLGEINNKISKYLCHDQPSK